MLNMIFVRDLTECPLYNLVVNPENIFTHEYKSKWLHDDFVHNIIEDVDKSTLSNNLIVSNRTGEEYSPYDLAGGTKTLMIMKFLKDKYVYDLSMLGSNCSFYLPKACSGDIPVFGVLPYPMKFNEVSEPFVCYNDGRLITTPEEYHAAYCEFGDTKYKELDWSVLTARYGDRFQQGDVYIDFDEEEY